MDKRRFIPFLPDVHQTETLKKYFGSTVDHVFQPGKPEQISGYIGQKPGYFDATKDFYVPEPTLARSAYQLEPAMMSYDAASSVSHMFFYDDLINYLRSSSAIISNQNRLFADQYMAWAPPVDLDKLNNFHQYYWYGDNPDLIPTLTLTATHTDYVGDGATYRFAMPAAVAGIPVERETPLVYVDTLLAAYERDGDALALTIVPQPGAQIVVFRYGDLRRAATGRKAFDPRPFGAEVPALSTSMRVHFNDGVSFYQGWDRLPWDTIFLHAPFRCHESYPVAWDGSADDRAASFFVEGVGASIEFVVCPQKSTLALTTAAYVTIDRRSRDGNPWSRNNFWVHGDAISWNGTPSADRRGVRPIVEFYPNIQLANYGRTRLPDITATLSGDLIYVPGAANPSSDPGDPLDLSDPTIARTALAVTEASGKRIGEIYVDGDHALRYGDRILVLSNSNPDIVNRILTVQRGQQGVVLPSGAESVTDILVLIAGGPPDHGDVVGGEVMVFNPYEIEALDTIGWVRHRPYKDYFFNGSSWVEGQGRQDADADPRFALFTDAGVAYGDLLGSAFEGNRLFGFAKGTGAIDPILKRRLKRTAPSNSQLRSEILFENDQVTVRHGGLPGLQNYKILGATAAEDTLHNGWTMTDDLSRQPLVGGVFTQPLNLIGNPDMEEVETTARAQWFDHVAAILSRQTGFLGSAYQHNNWRDTARSIGSGYTGPAWTAHTRYLVNATVTVAGIGYRCTAEHVSGAAFEAANWVMKPLLSIVQPRTPLLRTMLMTADRRFDYQDAVRFTDTEYQRFRNKFYHQIEAVARKGLVPDSASDDAWVDYILRALTTTKTNEFAFALSTMAGGQWFIPPTAPSMGLLSVVEPGFEWDDTYSPSIFILRGHDGSRTPMAVDRAASIMLALELRIWRAIKDKFKTEMPPAFDFYDLIDSRGRGPVNRTTSGDVDPCDDDPTPVETEKMTYSRDELVQIYTPIFMRWAQLNGYDYRKHDDYTPSDPFTWNYRGVKDVDGTEQVGNWRGIYRWFFDTDRPHQVPWEMLGFSTKPSWWEGFYGPAPYTRGNLPLWEDLRDGRVRGGVRAGIDTRFARPDLLSLLPIDDDGKLIDPVAAGIIPVAPKSADAMRTWVIGDHGPIENLWMMSASYPYARSIIGFLLRPAQWVEIGWNTDAFVELPDGQYYNGETHNRPRNATLKVHGEVGDTGARLSINGVQQWVSDMMTSRAQDPAIFGNAVRGLQVRLAHKMAGYTQAENLRVFADNFGIVPEEDISVLLHTSPPLREAVYSGVIVEWTGTGWSVVGYDTVKEGFCIVEGDVNGPQQVISLGDDPPIYEWRPGVNYAMNVLVDYRGSVYRCVRAHTAATKFEEEYWSAAPQNAVKIPKVTVYVNPTKIKNYVPYGTVFKTREEVARFLWEWGLAQEQDGFVFDGVDEVTGEIQNWELMIRKFLEWSQMEWQPGNFIALSPGASTLKFITAHGYVANLEETVNGAYGLIDRTGRPLARRTTFVSRLDEETKIITTTNNLFGARMRVIESEHVLVFSGTTIFNDLIYAPLYNLRQPRLRLIGIRSTPWAGRIDAPGYMVNGNDLLANFERASEDVRTMFEIEGSEDRVLRDHARHVIGYQKRPYLDNLLVSETQQFEFYQGMIQAKGAPTVFSRLTRSKVIDSYADLAFLEEWAMRVGQFGATDVHTDVAFRLNRTDLRANPQFVFFGAGTDSESTIFLPSNDGRWVTRPADPLRVFPAREPFSLLQGGGSPQTNVRPLLPSAGPVRVTEVDYAAFDVGYLNQLYTDVTRSGQTWDAGKRVWLYNRNDKISGYDVLRVYRVGSDTCFLWGIQTHAEDVTLGVDECRLIFSQPHGLTVADLGLLLIITGSTNVDTNSVSLEGFQTIGAIETGIDGSYSIRIPYPLDAGADLSLRDPGIAVYVMRSQRFATIAARDAFFAKYPPVAGQLVYVDEIAAPVTGAVDDLDGGTGIDVANPNSEPGRELDTPTTRAGDHALDGTTITYVPASAFEPYECRGWQGLDGVGSVPYEAITGQVPLKPYIPNDPGEIEIVEGDVCIPWRPIPEKPVVTPALHGWAVYLYGPEGFKLTRRRPEKIDSQRLTRALVYDLETDIVQDIATPNRPALRRTNATPRAEASSKKTPIALSAEPLRLEGMAIYDPIAGLIPGIAEREISYKTEFDPAQYFGSRAWGKSHLGEVWWDTSKVAYLEAETDILDSGDPERVAREIEYRRTYWGVLAPGSTVKVYEWVRSTVSPDNDVRADDLFLSGAYSMFEEFDEDLNQTVTAYYYWVPNIATVPVNNPKRSISTLAVSQVIQNPTKQDVPWLAPIMPNGMLVGGIDEFVNDVDSVFQFSVRETEEPCDGVIHNEYALVRKGDEVLPVPPNLLAQMNHALVGFDDLLQPVPDMALPERDRVGSTRRPRRSLLGADRAAMMAARRSYVQTVNAILARTNFLLQNPDALSTLSVETPVYDRLIFANNGTDRVIEAPPANSYAFVATSLEERDVIVGSPEYLEARGWLPWEKYGLDTTPFEVEEHTAYIARGADTRILVTNYETETPSWSIWELAENLDAYPEDLSGAFTLSHQFTVEFATAAEMITAAQDGQITMAARVLVRNDERFSGFWTLWHYLPGNGAADANGFVYRNAQTYRTADFIQVIDWYAAGYTALNGPIVSYPTAQARNIAENPKPANTFVRLEDDGTGSWAWTVFEEGTWNTVARQNGTIKLSDAFCDESRPVYGLGVPDLAQIPARDGSHELRQIENILRKSILSTPEITEVFFSLLHFAHAYNDQVNWAFKTSFMSIVGYNERLDQTPVQAYDTTDNLLDYVEEVKPYRVTVREFARVLTPPLEMINVHASDFDKPLYFDQVLNRYRRLSSNVPADVEIMRTTSPWKDWYENFQRMGENPALPDFNPVRRFDIEMRFDRYEWNGTTEGGAGWDLVPADLLGWDADESTRRTGGSAYARYLAYYKPTEGMRVGLDPLMGLDFKGTQVNGGRLWPPLPEYEGKAVSELDAEIFEELPFDGVLVTEHDSTIEGNGSDLILNPETGADAYALNDPYHEKDHPEELVRAFTNSALGFQVDALWVRGAPNQYTTSIETKGSRKASVRVPFRHVAGSAEAVFVYKDGVRGVAGVDYTVDHFDLSVTVNIPGRPKPRFVMVHVIGPSASVAITAQEFYDGDGARTRFPVGAAAGLIEVLVDGVRVAPGALSIDGQTIVLATAPAAGAAVMINAFEGAGSLVNQASVPSTHVRIDPLPYAYDQTWALPRRTRTDHLEVAGTIVEVEGLRLSPPFIRFGDFKDGNTILPLRRVADMANLSLFIDGQPYGGTIGHRVEKDDPEVTGYDFVLYEDHLYMENAAFAGADVAAIIREDHEYDVQDGVLTILKPLSTNGSVKDGLRIEVTTFENADLMDVETHVFDGSAAGLYVLRSVITGTDYAMVWVNGKRLVNGKQFELEARVVGAWEVLLNHLAVGYGDDTPHARVTIPGGQDLTDRVVITLANGRPADLPTTWGMISAVASPSLMGNPAFASDLDSPLGFDQPPLVTATQRTGISPQGDRPVFRMDNTWETFAWERWSDAVLVQDLHRDDEEIKVQLNPRGISAKLFAQAPFATPDPEHATPGVLWLDGERIEYFSMETEGQIVTFGEIRRGTRSTFIGAEDRKVALYPGNGSWREFGIEGATLDRVVEVSIREANGHVLGLKLDRDYTLRATATGVIVTMNRVPQGGETLALAQTIEHLHKAGRPVRNATRRVNPERGSPFRIRDDVLNVGSEPYAQYVRNYPE